MTGISRSASTWVSKCSPFPCWTRARYGRGRSAGKQDESIRVSGVCRASPIPPAAYTAMQRWSAWRDLARSPRALPGDVGQRLCSARPVRRRSGSGIHRHYCRTSAPLDNVFQFGSTSKVTFAGAGVAFLASSAATWTRCRTPRFPDHRTGQGQPAAPRALPARQRHACRPHGAHAGIIGRASNACWRHWSRNWPGRNGQLDHTPGRLFHFL